MFLSIRGPMKHFNQILNEIKLAEKLTKVNATTESTDWGLPVSEIMKMKLKLTVMNI